MNSRPSISSIFVQVLVGCLLLGLIGVPAGAQDDDSKLQIHGFLSQAWVTGSFLEGRFPNPDGSPAGPTLEELALGIPEDGTFDYRNLAIQFRYDITDKDVMIVQFSSRSLGDSPINDIEDEVELDWAFYERRLAANTSVKIGRVQIPYGIFNEIRDVGTILPFYAPPFEIYRAGAFTSETVDGLTFSHLFAANSDWNFQTDFYIGEWDLVEFDLIDGSAEFAEAQDAYGTQFWLGTPILGLRLGLAYQHREVSGGNFRAPGGKSKFDDYLLSVDGNFDRWVFRSEYREFGNDPELIPAFGADDFEATFTSYYAQLGWHATPKVRLYAQYQQTHIEANTSIFTEKQDFDAREDLGISFNYVFSPNAVFKVEHHEISGQDQSFLPVFGPGGFQLQPIFADLDDGSYTIVSFSSSF